MGRISAYLNRRKQLKELHKNHSFHVAIPSTERNEIRFHLPEKPLISILIYFQNNQLYVRKCLLEISKNLPKHPLELILVDDNSDDQFSLSDLKGIHSIRNEQTQGFVKSINQGIQQARGEFIYLLDAASIVHNGFLDELLSVFEEHTDVGAVGSKILNTKGKLLEAGSVFLKDAKLTHVAGKPSYYPEFNYCYQVDYCSARSLLFRKLSDNGMLNLFNEDFTASYFAEADLCYRLKHEQGKHIFYSPFSKIVHYQGVTKGFTSNLHIKEEAYERNFQTFKQKWSKELAAIKAHSIHHRILEFCTRGSIVFFNDQVPQYDNNSGELRLTEIMKAFKQLNYHVTLVTLENDINNSYNAYFQRLGIAVLYLHSRKSTIARYFKAMSYATPRIWMHSATTFNRFHKTARETFKKFDLIFDMVDIHHLRHKRASELFPEDKGISAEYHRYLKIETEASQLADIVIPISEQERDYMRSLCADEKMLVISNIHYAKINLEETPRFADREGLLFVGSLHTPNIDAINYLIDDIMPLIWQTDPSIKLHIVGNVAQCFPAERKSLPNVIFHGFVPEIRPYYLQHRIIVAPLRYGAGVKGKIGQALEYHVPVVSSEIGTEGMFLIDGKHILIAETPEDFAAKTLSLYSDETLWKALQANAISGLAPFSKEELYKKIKQMQLMLN